MSRPGSLYPQARGPKCAQPCAQNLLIATKLLLTEKNNFGTKKSTMQINWLLKQLCREKRISEPLFLSLHPISFTSVIKKANVKQQERTMWGELITNSNISTDTYWKKPRAFLPITNLSSLNALKEASASLLKTRKIIMVIQSI